MVVSGFTGTGEDALVLDKLGGGGRRSRFYDLDDDGAADSDFLFTATPERNGAVIVVDRKNPDRGASCGVITDIDEGTNTVTGRLRGERQRAQFARGRGCGTGRHAARRGAGRAAPRTSWRFRRTSTG